MRKIFGNPGLIVSVFLTALYALAFSLKIGVEGVMPEVVRLAGLAVGLLLPELIVMIVAKSRPQLSNIFITYMLLVLIGDQKMGIGQAVLLGFSTALVKTVMRWKHQPIINPAAGGLMLASFLGVLVTWWGISFAPRLIFFNMSVTMLLTVPFGIYVILRYKKLPTLISVPVAFLAVYYLLAGRLAITTVLEGTFAFFLLIMATEPKTSPLLDWQEWIYGSFLGGLLGWIFLNRILGTPYLAALVAANLLFFAIKFGQLKLATRKVTT